MLIIGGQRPIGLFILGNVLAEIIDQQSVALPQPVDELTDLDFPRMPPLVALPLLEHRQLDEDFQQFIPKRIPALGPAPANACEKPAVLLEAAERRDQLAVLVAKLAVLEVAKDIDERVELGLFPIVSDLNEPIDLLTVFSGFLVFRVLTDLVDFTGEVAVDVLVLQECVKEQRHVVAALHLFLVGRQIGAGEFF